MGKSVQLNFRITPQLRDVIESAASRSGLTVADWLRAVVARAANEGAFAPRKGKANERRSDSARKPRAGGG
jgi:uncharacterized protein (DUF1778 family)